VTAAANWQKKLLSTYDDLPYLRYDIFISCEFSVIIAYHIIAEGGNLLFLGVAVNLQTSGSQSGFLFWKILTSCKSFYIVLWSCMFMTTFVSAI